MAIAGISALEPVEILTKTRDGITAARNPRIAGFFKDIQRELMAAAATEAAAAAAATATQLESFTSMADVGSLSAPAPVPTINEIDDLENTEEGGMADGGGEDEDADVPQSSEWLKNQYLAQSDNAVQSNKITERSHDQVDVFSDQNGGNEHYPMKQDQLGVNSQFTVPVAQDSLNPTLKNTVSRFINLDSQFRQYSNGSDSSSDYTLDLSDQLTNALSIRMYSYEIPFTWYAFDLLLGNVCMWVKLSTGTVIPVTIESGNYSPDDFVVELTRAVSASFDPPTGSTNAAAAAASYGRNTGKLALLLDGWTHIDSGVVVDEGARIIFHDITGALVCGGGACSAQKKKADNYINQTLGWYMGFRDTSIDVRSAAEGGNRAEAVADFIGTKYIMLVVDDYNQNHVNNGIVSISETFSTVKLPSYYSSDMPRYCIPPSATSNNLAELESGGATGLLLAGKATIEYTSTHQVVPSAPRTLTEAQIYTINEIHKNRNNGTQFKSRAPTNANVLAIIPLKRTTFTMGTVITDFSGSLQDNARTYFGPVNIERMRIKLLDDKGNVLNMNGSDWCVTLIATCLYQY